MFPGNIFPEALIILEKLQSSGVLPDKDFYLAGGTGLALQIGHRFSEDLDLFTSRHFEPEEIVHLIRKQYEFTVIGLAPGTLHTAIRGVRTSFLFYPYRLLFPLSSLKDCRIADYRDIAAMKLIAVSQRGSKKDFVDLYYLLKKRLDLQDLKIIAARKFSGVDYSWPHLLRSIAYFDDADNDPMPIMTPRGKRRSLRQTEWEKIKTFLRIVQKKALQELHSR